ncbi:hypothetical protein [Bifidobacterium callitrichos]|uniref:Uncharacterized protein n=1 Tax=Bifidobacterium callitrichos DSM 23973 TaxID=1437609 RepID=A0A087ACR3_9BIFI|nr:hypothetical protein [Bifidobacterium callitrichos]KFI56563.1 hypothetical protein BCAL_0158 [Bifidobacterium callitrichos DSM 23973]
MSIITREAELKYPDTIPGMDPTPLRSGYVDGADREWTDIEIMAAAETAVNTWKLLSRNAERIRPADGESVELGIAREAVTAAWRAAHNVATKEES